MFLFQFQFLKFILSAVLWLYRVRRRGWSRLKQKTVNLWNIRRQERPALYSRQFRRPRSVAMADPAAIVPRSIQWTSGSRRAAALGPSDNPKLDGQWIDDCDGKISSIPIRAAVVPLGREKEIFEKFSGEKYNGRLMIFDGKNKLLGWIRFFGSFWGLENEWLLWVDYFLGEKWAWQTLTEWFWWFLSA